MPGAMRPISFSIDSNRAAVVVALANASRGGQPRLDEQRELARVAAMFEHTGIGAEGDRHAQRLCPRHGLTHAAKRHADLFLSTVGV